jgi:hypothetical protein
MAISGSAALTQRGHDLDANIDYGVAKGLDAAVSNAMAKANTDLFVELQENEGTISISFAQTWAKLIASPICGKPPGGRGLRAPQATPGTVPR